MTKVKLHKEFQYESGCWRQSLKEILIIRFKINGKMVVCVTVLKENDDFSTSLVLKDFSGTTTEPQKFYGVKKTT